MATKQAILLGIAFVFIGIIMAMCDRWQLKLEVIGKPTTKKHEFDHMFIIWLLSQLLQSSLLLFKRAIDKNWLGFGRFKHGEVPPRQRNTELRQIAQANIPDADGNGHAGDGALAEGDANINQDARDNEPIIQNNRRKNKKPSFLVYFPPAFFAQAHTLLLYFGLKLTYPSSFIMLKGTVAFFTALLSMAFMASQLACYVWFGVVVATLGFGVSGISDYIKPPPGGYEKYGIAAGDLLIVMAQIMFATKIIYEEKFIRQYSIHPMTFLGAEGLYTSFFAFVFFLVFEFVDAVQYSVLPNQHLEDIVDAWYQFTGSWQVILAVIGGLFTYIIYTYLGMFLIRDQGALPRIMIETFIWAIYWAICLGLHWENFFIAQVPGLCVIAIGSLIYSHILLIPFVSRREQPVNGPDVFGGRINGGGQNNAPVNPVEDRDHDEQDGNGHVADDRNDDDDDERIILVDDGPAENDGQDVPMVQA